MAPTPVWMMLTFTCSSDSLVSVSASTSAEPCTSALMMIASSLTPALGDLLLQRLERHPAGSGAEGLLLGLLLPEHDDLPRLGRVLEHLERVAGLRQAAEAEHFHRRRRRRVR